MEWIQPVSPAKTVVKYSSSLLNPDEGDCKIVHGSFPDAGVSWFASGDRLDTLSTDHCGVQSRHFQCSQGQEFVVTSVAEIPGEPLALVGLSSSTGSGAVALYNYSTSLILNSWSVSHKVTAICGGVELPGGGLRQFLNVDCFLFALGTEEGHVMLFAIDQHFRFCEGTHQLELNIVHYVTTDDILNRRASVKPPVVLVVPLNDPMYRAGRFIMESMDENGAVLSKRQEDVNVTALAHIPQTQSLCVGYSVQGAFQMFSLKTLELDFSGFALGCNNESVDQVLDFAFLEPEDDPRKFCYLAVVAQSKQAAPYALLYSLSYSNTKETAVEGTNLYEDLTFVSLRMDVNFGPLITGHVDGGRQSVQLVACRSLPSSVVSSPANNSTRSVSCNGVCYFAMRWTDSLYVAIFDLNQWYQAQMPVRWIFSDDSRLCPFLGFFHQPMQDDGPRQAWIQADTLSVFHRSSTAPAEAFFYPSALSFRLVTVSPVETVSVLFLGIQSLLLHKLSLAGSHALTHPHRYYVQAVRAGLTSSDVSSAPNVTEMAEALLNIGLENNVRSFLIGCIKDEGANLNFVEKWAWQQVLRLKALRETVCQPLFDHSTADLEPQVHAQLYSVTHQLTNLTVLYDVMDKRIRALNSGVNDKLRDKSRATYLLSVHLETVVWFVHGGLLPECDGHHGQQDALHSLPYPYAELDRFYAARRHDIESLSRSVEAGQVLLVDQLVPASVAAVWAQERGSDDTAAYPPPSLYALLSAYLRPDVDDVTKHRLVQYVFMDLTWLYGRHPQLGAVLEHLVTFPSTYSLKPSVIKVTQAFWHLDHRNFDDALGMLLDPLVHTTDMTNGQQRAVLRAFLYQDQRRHALKYATLRHPVCPQLDDIQLHLSILMANGLMADALGYVRRNRNQRNGHELMRHLLVGCQEMRKFGVLLTLPLSPDEEDSVTAYLKQSRNVDLHEALLLFYIQRCKYPDAIAYSERLNQMWPARDAASRERFNRRQMLMQTLVDALPPITCKLAAIANCKPTVGKASRDQLPQPLSVAVLPATAKIQSTGSNFFQTVIERTRATRLIEEQLDRDAQTPLRSRKRKLQEEHEEATGVASTAESTPFLSNIVQPSKRNVTLGVSLAFPSPQVASDASSMDIGQTAVDAADAAVGPKMGKRPRQSLFPPSVVAVKTDADVVSVLQTPPVRRVRPGAVGSVGDSVSASRPASILRDQQKRRFNFSSAAASPAPAPAPAHTDSRRPLAEAESDEMEMTVTADTSSRQLRFSLPAAATPSPTTSTNDEMDMVEQTAPAGSSVLADEFVSFVEDSSNDACAPVAVPPADEEPQASTGVEARGRHRPDTAHVEMDITLANATMVAAGRVPGLVLDETVAADVGHDTSNVSMDMTRPTTCGANRFADTTQTHYERSERTPTALPQVKAPAADTHLDGDVVDDDDDESDVVCLDSSSEEDATRRAVGGDGDDGQENLAESEEEEEADQFDEHGLVDRSAGADSQPTAVVDVDSLDGDEQTDADGENRLEPLSVSLSSSENESSGVDERPDRHATWTATSYSLVEAGLDDDRPIEEEDDGQQDDHRPVEPVDVYEEEEETDAISEYSRVEEGLEYDDDDDDDVQDAAGMAQEGHDTTVAGRPVSSVVHVRAEEDSVVMSEGDSVAGDGLDAYDDDDDDDGQDFELNLSDMSSHNATRRSSVRRSTHRRSIRRRATLGQTAATSCSDGEQERQQSPRPLVQQPEPSPRAERAAAESDEEEPVERLEMTGTHSRPTQKTRLQFSDDESSSGRSRSEEEDDDDDGTGPTVDAATSEAEEDGATADSVANSHSVRLRKRRIQLTDSSSNDSLSREPVETASALDAVVEESTPERDDQGESDGRADLTEMWPNRSARLQRTKLELTDGESSEEEEKEEEEEGREKDAQQAVDSPVDQVLDEERADADSSVYHRTAKLTKTRLQLSDSESSADSEAEANVDRPAPSPHRTEADEPTRQSSEDPSAEDDDDDGDLRDILQRHTVVQVAVPSDAIVIPANTNNLSVILEESRTLDQSMAAGVAEQRSLVLAVVGEADESGSGHGLRHVTPPPPTVDEVEEELNAVVTGETPANVRLIDTLDAGAIDREDDGHDEPAQHGPVPQLEARRGDDEDDELPVQVDPITTRRRGRPKSLKLGPSLVPLPFSSRRSTWDGDVSPDSACPQIQLGDADSAASVSPLAETTAAPTQRSPRSHVGHSVRRSTRLAAGTVDALVTPVDEQPPAPASTPPKVSKRRSSVRRIDEAGGESSSFAVFPPSADVSPTDSVYSGRSSAPGTPVRRSSRLANRATTPEPARAAAELMISGITRTRRRSASGQLDVSLTAASPLRRSGRLSANASRDNSPDSVASEPALRSTVPPATGDVTPKRGVGRSRKGASKPAALSLLPVEEEETDQLTVHAIASDADSSGNEDGAKEASAAPNRTKTTTTTKQRRKSASANSSPSTSHYNLRRTRRNSDLGIISEEDQPSADLLQAAAATSATSATGSLKRRRNESKTEDEGAAAGPSAGVRDASSEETETRSDNESSKPQRKSKRKKAPDGESDGELHFAPVPRPPPKNLPKREPVIKTRASRGRKSMIVPEN